jgi:erythromycin esterase-like protein
MLGKQEHALASAIRRSAHPLTGENTDFDPLLKTIGDSRFVLIGEATHGTHDVCQ